ncbi:MAG: recombinase family protein, partial [Thiovulaceae bacterium]|nr:recombinase family protein [Sulfurimonadaceae bacterium]
MTFKSYREFTLFVGLYPIYGYFAQTEREIISERTKQGLAVAREMGKILGRPKGAKNKTR